MKYRGALVQNLFTLHTDNSQLIQNFTQYPTAEKDSPDMLKYLNKS